MNYIHNKRKAILIHLNLLSTEPQINPFLTHILYADYTIQPAAMPVHKNFIGTGYLSTPEMISLPRPIW